MVCPSTGSPSQIPCLIGTNAAIFRVFAHLSHDFAGPEYFKKLRIHSLCLEAYSKKEKELSCRVLEGPVGTIQLTGTLVVLPPHTVQLVGRRAKVSEEAKNK